MATDMLTWARRQVFEPMNLSSSERFVLLLLADNSSWDEDTGRWYAFPFQKTLARESGLSERTVKRAISRLLELRVISTERRKRASGFIAGNGYVFHPEAVAEPITRTVKDAVEAVGEQISGPGFSGGETMSSLEIAGGDTMSPDPNDPHDPRRGHSVPSGPQGTPCPLGGDTVAHPTRADREDVRARLNRHSESSSSSAGEAAAGAADNEDDEQSSSQPNVPAHGFGTVASAEERTEPDTWRGVDLDVLGAQVVEATGLDCGRNELVWLVDSILARSRRQVGRPASFVRTAIANDPAGTRAELLVQFGAPPATVEGAAGGVRRKKSPPCPIPEHAEQGLLKVNCPACRGIWDEPFPAVITRSVFEQLDGVVQERVLRAAGVEVLDDERATA